MQQLSRNSEARFAEVHAAPEPMRVGGQQVCCQCLVCGSHAAGPSCPIKGNVNSKGERIYHEPGDRDYDRVVYFQGRGGRMEACAAMICEKISGSLGRTCTTHHRNAPHAFGRCLG